MSNIAEYKSVNFSTKLQAVAKKMAKKLWGYYFAAPCRDVYSYIKDYWTNRKSFQPNE